MDLAQWSSNLLYISFILYLIATLFFGGSIRDKNNKNKGVSRWGKIGMGLTLVGFAAQLGYFFTRWFASGHAPVSNLFEFTTFFGMMLVGAFIIIYFLYHSTVLGLFALPIALLVIAYASMFPREVSPLIPALQSDWLKIHVTTVAAGEAILAISFVAGLIYLLKKVNHAQEKKQSFWLESVMYGLVVVVGFIVSTTAFSLMGYNAEFQYVNQAGQEAVEEFKMPALVAPHEGELLTADRFEPAVDVPSIVNALKLNTVLWSFIAGTVIYWILRLAARKN